MSLITKMAGYFSRGPMSINNPRSWDSINQRNDANVPVNPETVLGLSAVWACINLVADVISTLPLMVYREKNGLQDTAFDHPLYPLLHDSPNYDQTAVDFWSFMVASLELWGNAYARIERSGSRIVSLMPVNPTFMVPRRIDTGAIEYRWTEYGQAFREPDQNILHIRGFGGNPLGGMSTLHFGRQTFGLASAINSAAASTFANGMRPSMLIKFAKWLTKEQRDTTNTVLIEKFMGAVNAGRPLVLEGGTDVTPLSLKPEDAQMLESRAFSIEEICRYFRVPPVMIGHTEKTTSWPTGVEQQGLILQKFTLKPRLKRIEQAMAKQLLTPDDRGRGVSIEFNMEGLLRGDSAGRADFYGKMAGMGAMTINEIRAKENLTPVEGGDVPRMQMQNVPITTQPPMQNTTTKMIDITP